LDELDRRIEKCKRILKGNPNSQIFAALADCYLKKGEPRKAYDICANGLRKYPNYGSAHLVMAKIALSISKIELAKKSLQTAIAFNGRNRAIDYWECKIAIEAGELRKAGDLISKIKRWNRNNSVIAELEYMLYEAQKTDDNPNRKPQNIHYGAQNKVSAINQKDTLADNDKNRHITVDSMIKSIASLPSMEYAIAFNFNGDVQASYGENGKIETAAEFGKAAVHGLRHGLSKAGFGELKGFLLEADDRTAFLQNMGNFYLLCEGDSKINLGVIGLQISEMLKQLKG